MKTIKIHTHPEYWGSAATDTEAKRLAKDMAERAEAAGFSFDGWSLDGTTDAAMIYSQGEDSECEADNQEIDWFTRWCAHGFRSMIPWLRKQMDIQ